MIKDLDKGLSVYLDMLRFLAAFAVVMSHVWRLVFPSFPLPWPGHAAVIVFFVISGYVIAFAADRPGLTAGRYVLHRAVRIMSVTVPALLLSVCIAPVAGQYPIPLAGHIPFPPSEFWHAIWMNLLFLGESWYGRVLPPFNPPYWSLSYEVWYYAIFGTWIFCPRRWRLGAAAAVALFAGLKIALLLPVWLLGVAAYRWRYRYSSAVALRLFVFSMISGLAYFWFDCSVQIRTALQQSSPRLLQGLHGSDQFIGDFPLALIVAVHFVAAASMGPYFRRLIRIENTVKYLASFTLSIYLLHMPLTVLIWNGLGIHNAAAYAVLLVAGIVAIGSMTERKNRELRRWLEKRCGFRQVETSHAALRVRR